MEIWKDVPGYEGLYRVSDQGRVYSVRNEIVLKPVNSVGYCVVTLSDHGKAKLAKVHRLVAMAFIPNPENKPTVNHINEIKTDNRACNLEWATVAEQNAHGTRLQRAAKTRCREIRQYSPEGQLIRTWPSLTQAANELGIGKGGIWAALEGRVHRAGGYIWKRSIPT